MYGFPLVTLRLAIFSMNSSVLSMICALRLLLDFRCVRASLPVSLLPLRMNVQPPVPTELIKWSISSFIESAKVTVGCNTKTSNRPQSSILFIRVTPSNRISGQVPSRYDTQELRSGIWAWQSPRDEESGCSVSKATSVCALRQSALGRKRTFRPLY